MKISSTLKMLLAGVVLGVSSVSSASVYHDNVTTSFNLGVGANAAEDYVGSVNVGGVDTWAITLLGAAGLTVDVTTSQSTGVINPQTLANAVAMLKNISHVDLVDGSNNILGGANALNTLTNFGSLSTLNSTVTFSVANLLMPGTYFLKIYGDDATSYSGTISAVPLPAAAWLFGSALLGLGALRRKQKAGDNSEMALA